MLLDECSPDQALADLKACCGSSAWAKAMLDRRPFKNMERLFNAADEVWASLDSADWLEAFASHPRIGELKPSEQSSAGGSKHLTWAGSEQAGVNSADRDLLEAIRQSNEEYLKKFGYIYIVCATGKTAGQMYEMLSQRLKNSSEIELPIAAEEQRKITRIRLEKLCRPAQ